MFDYLKGHLTDASFQKMTIEVNGVGYLLYISVATFEKLPKMGEITKVFISSVIREDSHKLFGFLNREERNFFETLCEISGIGPRLALAILGHMSLEEIHLAVEYHDTKAIAKVPGIGKKMAERLILELRDKCGKSGKETFSPAPPAQKGPTTDAISALVNLGYTPLEAQSAVQTALGTQETQPPLSELISLALKAKKR